MEFDDNDHMVHDGDSRGQRNESELLIREGRKQEIGRRNDDVVESRRQNI